MNCDKSQLIFFHKSRTKLPGKLKIKLNGTILKHTHAIKYLGVYLDETLSGDQHCTELAKILSRANGMLSKARHYAPNEIKTMYHALFSSHLNYGSQIWGQANNIHQNKIFLLQKAALRIINFSNFRTHSSPLFKENYILKLNDCVTLENSLFVYDFLKDKLPKCFKNYFKTLKESYNSSMNTRNSKSGCLYLPSVISTKYGLNSIKIKSINSWNYFSITFKEGDLLQLSRSELKK